MYFPNFELFKTLVFDPLLSSYNRSVWSSYSVSFYAPNCFEFSINFYLAENSRIRNSPLFHACSTYNDCLTDLRRDWCRVVLDENVRMKNNATTTKETKRVRFCLRTAFSQILYFCLFLKFLNPVKARVYIVQMANSVWHFP